MWPRPNHLLAEGVGLLDQLRELPKIDGLHASPLSQFEEFFGLSRVEPILPAYRRQEMLTLVFREFVVGVRDLDQQGASGQAHVWLRHLLLR